jgi:hypothetical protein
MCASPHVCSDQQHHALRNSTDFCLHWCLDSRDEYSGCSSSPALGSQVFVAVLLSVLALLAIIAIILVWFKRRSKDAGAAASQPLLRSSEPARRTDPGADMLLQDSAL